jgi:hypothetical protein
MRVFARAISAALFLPFAVGAASAGPRPTAQVVVTVQGSGVVKAPGINCRQSSSNQGESRANACTTRVVLPYNRMKFSATGSILRWEKFRAKDLMWEQVCRAHRQPSPKKPPKVPKKCALPVKSPTTRVQAVFGFQIHSPSGVNSDLR